MTWGQCFLGLWSSQCPSSVGPPIDHIRSRIRREGGRGGGEEGQKKNRIKR